jgi:hypothetical protein
MRPLVAFLAGNAACGGRLNLEAGERDVDTAIDALAVLAAIHALLGGGDLAQLVDVALLLGLDDGVPDPLLAQFAEILDLVVRLLARRSRRRRIDGVDFLEQFRFAPIEAFAKLLDLFLAEFRHGEGVTKGDDPHVEASGVPGATRRRSVGCLSR